MFKKEHKEGTERIDDVETIIGPSVKIEGEFTSSGNLIVGGVISGKLSTTRIVGYMRSVLNFLCSSAVLWSCLLKVRSIGESDSTLSFA